MKTQDRVLTEEEMRKRAAEGYFVRDLEKDRVYCPTGEVLRKKAVKKNGDTRYANTRSPWKEVDFPDKVREARNLNWLRAEK